MNIVWSPEALADLASVHAFITQENPAAAQRMVLRIVDAVETLLAEHPQIGRAGRVSGTRELVIAETPYIVPYRVVRGSLQVLRVYHAARRWPDRF
jgi:toxin ParE1/3/4